MPAPKRRITVGKVFEGIREDCADNDCFQQDCDVCHVHDEPADPDTGLCESCLNKQSCPDCEG